MHLYHTVVKRYRACSRLPSFWLSVMLSGVAFAGAVAINNFAIEYATLRASNSVTDIILSNIPVFDVDGIFVYGIALLVLFIAILLLLNPKKIPFTLYSLALFYVIRAGFISLTHVGPFPSETPILFSTPLGTFLSNLFLVGDDLFFSAHTGAPFLMALIFWESKPLRYFFLASSVFFGTIALLGHIHYSIDVASAFFITFGIYHISKWLFKEHHGIFSEKY